MDFKGKEEKKDKRELCIYGSNCYQKNPFHMAKFRHPKRTADNTIEQKNKKAKQESTSEESSCTDRITDVSPERSVNSVEVVSEEKMDCSSKLHDISDSSDDEINPASKEANTYVQQASSSLTEQDLIVVSKLKGDDKSKLKQLYVVEFPDDFFRFYEFCKSVYSKTPKTALRDVDLELVGPFDYLSGNIKSCTSDAIIRHYRFYYDPPEFFTILKSNNSEFHYGYFFDDPNKLPAFVASNDPSKSCTITVVAPNIFGAVNSHIVSFIKTCDPFKKVKVQRIQSNLIKWAKENKISVELNPYELKKRNSNVCSKTFHGAGIVVPYDSKTDVGYRSLAENDKTLIELFNKIMESKTESDRDNKWNKIEHVITYASIAADECDFGTPLELGIDMFSTGHECFHRTALRLMSTAYNLLGRNHFSKIIDVHLKNRLKGSNLNFAALKK